jgi:hypothetical protein
LADSGCAKSALFWPTSRTALGEFPVDGNGGHGTNAEAFRPAGDGWLVHVEDRHLARRTRDAVDQLDSLLACRAPGTEDFDLSLGGHVGTSF